MGKIELDSEHILMAKPGNFGISSLLQQQMCFMGQSQVFKEASDTFLRLTGVAVNASQIERVCHHYGEELEQITLKQIRDGGQDRLTKIGGVHYVMLDGSMLLTREQKWKEIKLGRIFKSDDLIQASPKRKEITTSLYVAHLGNHTDFFDKLEYHTDVIPEKIFIADGAKWIWNWVESTYPNSTQILDFYHAKEHLCQYAKLSMVEDNLRDEWIERMCGLMLNDQINLVIQEIKTMPVKGNKEKQEKRALIGYYKQHAHRMMYKTYKQKKLLIGSGAIEAAHRHVLQQRLKLSGQRWTAKGLQQVANIRVAYRSNLWQNVIGLTKLAA